VHNWKTRHTVI